MLSLACISSCPVYPIDQREKATGIKVVSPATTKSLQSRNQAKQAEAAAAAAAARSMAGGTLAATASASAAPAAAAIAARSLTMDKQEEEEERQVVASMAPTATVVTATESAGTGGFWRPQILVYLSASDLPRVCR